MLFANAARVVGIVHDAGTPDAVYVYGSVVRPLVHHVTRLDPDVDECTSVVTVYPLPSGSLAVDVNVGLSADVNHAVDPDTGVNWYDCGATSTGADAALGFRLYVNVMYGSVVVSEEANFFHP